MPHLLALLGTLWAGVHGGPAAFTDLLNLGLELLALEEDDEHRLVHRITLMEKVTVNLNSQIIRTKYLLHAFLVYPSTQTLALPEHASTHRHRVLQGLWHFRLTDEDVAATHTPQHALKHGHALPVGYAAHEPENEEWWRRVSEDQLGRLCILLKARK